MPDEPDQFDPAETWGEDASQAKPISRDPREQGATRAAVGTLRSGCAPQVVNPGAEGAGMTGIPYDPFTACGVPLTRLDHNPFQRVGSSGVVVPTEEEIRGMLVRDPDPVGRLAAWVEGRARQGGYPPPWCRSWFAARGRGDLAAWCDGVAQSLQAQGA